MRIVTKNCEETKKLAFNLVKKLKSGTVLCLYGDLGAGKTTFTQGLAEVFGIKKIISPTFVLIRQYKIKSNFPCHSRPVSKHGVNSSGNLYNYHIDPRVKPEDDRYFCHVDLYRLNNLEEIKALGIEEIMNDKKNLVIIEWAEKLGKLLPKKRVDIHFKYLESTKREIVINFL